MEENDLTNNSDVPRLLKKKDDEWRMKIEKVVEELDLGKSRMISFEQGDHGHGCKDALDTAIIRLKKILEVKNE